MSEWFESPVKDESISPILQEEWHDLSLLTDHVVEHAGEDHSIDDDYLREAEWYSVKHQAKIKVESTHNDSNDEVIWVGVIPDGEDADETWYRYEVYDPEFGGKRELALYEGDAEFPEYILPDSSRQFSDHIRQVSEYLKTAPVDIRAAPTDTDQWTLLFRTVIIEAASADEKVLQFANEMIGQRTFLYPHSDSYSQTLRGIVDYLKHQYSLTENEAYRAIDIVPEPGYWQTRSNSQDTPNRKGHH